MNLRTTSQSRLRSTALLVGEPLAKPGTLRGLPRPLLQGEVAMRSIDGEVARRENLPENVVQNGNAGCGTTSQSRIRSTAPLVGEPLAKPETLQGLPRPLLQGEVAMRSIDGEVARRENLPENVVKNGNAGCGTTSQSRSRSTALLVGEPLARPETLQGLPKPLLPGEVAMRSIDGEVVSAKT